ELAQSPLFACRSEIDHVEPLIVGGERMGKAPPVQHLRGAVISLRAPRTVTGQWLSRAIHCHLQRHRSSAVPIDDCPLALVDDAIVLSANDGFEIRLQANAPDRARALLGSVTALQSDRP